MAMTYYGPNAKLFADIGSSLWGEPIEDIAETFKTMSFLFSVDTIGAIINAICLWKLTNLNMFKEFAGVIKKYWYFLVFNLSVNLNFYMRDVNLGIDSSGKFEWITSEGRLNLILNSTDLTNEEKSIFLINTTLN